MKYFLLAMITFLTMMPFSSKAQEDTAGKKVVKLQYFNVNNSMQYLLLESTIKKNKTFTAQRNKEYQLYLDSFKAELLVARVITDANGKAKAFLPTNLQAAWNASAEHIFIVKSGDEEIISDFTINKVKLAIDTSTTEGVRNIVASAQRLENNEWKPAADVEMRIGIKRMGGILSAGEAETYTTDSTGTVSVELNKLNIPGDSLGNYLLAISVQDNELYGNLLVEKKVAWGKATKANNTFFDQRTLWTTRFKTPFWLLFLVYGIAIGVWATILYLVLQIIKIKKAGDSKTIAL